MLVVALASACAAPPPEATDPFAGAPVEAPFSWESVEASYVYRGEEGPLRATRVDEIPAPARSRVRVVTSEAREQPPSGHVWVASFAGPTPELRAVPRGAFEDWIAPRPSEPAPSEATEVARGGARPAIRLFGAAWCGACRRAREHFEANRIPFDDVDIERDPNGRRDMREAMARAGIHGNGIPVIEVGDDVFQGFDPGRIDRAVRAR